MDASPEARPSGFGRLLPAGLFRPSVGKALLIFLGVLPGIVLLAYIQAFAVNVPFMDDWQFVPLLEKAKNGALTFPDLFAPHDEHRLLVPRIIIIASMFATGGEYRTQSYITFIVVAVTSACLLWLMIRLHGNKSSVLGTGSCPTSPSSRRSNFTIGSGRCNLPTSSHTPVSRFASALCMPAFHQSRSSSWQLALRWPVTTASSRGT